MAIYESQPAQRLNRLRKHISVPNPKYTTLSRRNDMTSPNLVFGAGGIGTTAKSFTYTWDDFDKVNSLLSTLRDLDVLELDSAASYPPGNPWNTETLLGEAKAGDKGFIIDTKVAAHGGNRLNDQGISSSIDRSLTLLGVEKVRTLYAHTPDLKTPIEETAAAFHKEYVAGKFERVYMNFPNLGISIDGRLARNLQLYHGASGRVARRLRRKRICETLGLSRALQCAYQSA